MSTKIGAALLAAALGLSAQPARAAPLSDEFINADIPEREQYRTAGDLFRNGSFAAAAKNYRAFADDHPKDSRAAEARVMAAEALYRQAMRDAGQGAPVANSLPEARREYQKAEKSISRDDQLAAGVGLRLAEIDFNLGRYAEAGAAAARVRSDSLGGGLRAEARLLQGRALLALGKHLDANNELKALLAEHPAYEGDTRFALLFGVSLFEIGDSSGSLKYLERLEDPYANLYAARAHLRLGKPLVSVERLRKVETSDPAGPLVELARYLKAEAFFASKDYPTAMSAYEDFLRKSPRSAYRPAAMFKMGLCHFEREDYLAARGSFQSVLQLAAQSEFAEPALYMTGEAFLREGRLKEASLAYADMAASFPGTLGGTARFKQAWAHYRQGELPSAEMALKVMLSEQPGHRLAPAGALLLGNTLAAQERFTEASKAYGQALDLLPGAPMPEDRRTELREASLALLSRSNLLARDYGRLVSGYQYLMKHSKASLNPWRAASLLFIAEGYYRQALFDQAIGIYQEVLNTFPIAPESTLAVDGLAWAYFSKGDFARAEAEWKRLPTLRERPAVAPGKTILPDGALPEGIYLAAEYEGATSKFNQKKYLEALEAYEAFETAHSSHPLAIEAGLQAGWCYYRLEYYGQALKVWERVETTYADSPNASKAAWAISDTYFRAGRHDRAIASYERILQRYPNDPQANHARMRIAQSYYNAKDLLKAVAAFEAMVQAAPDSSEASQVLDFLTTLLYQEDAKQAALDSLERISNSRPDSPVGVLARFRIAVHLYEKGDHPAVIANLEPLMSRLAGRGEIMDGQFYLADSYYQLKRYKEAALAFERFAANYPGDKRQAAALFHLGASRFKLEEFGPAAEAFARVGTESTASAYAPIALFNTALAYRKLGKWDEAAVALKRYMEKFPAEAKNSDALLELAAIYEENRQFALAVELLASQRDPLPPDDGRRLELTVRIADSYSALGQEAKAVTEYRAAAASPLKRHEHRLAALAKLGEFYEKNERWPEAREVYQDIAQNSSDKAWIEAAQTRAQAATAKIAAGAAPAAPAAPPEAAPPAKPSAPAQEKPR